jgi:ferredoxin
MSFVITSLCIRSGSCALVCPIECIVPGPKNDPNWDNQYFIDSDSCIDCGACEPECPMSAIFDENDVPEEYLADIGRAKNFFTNGPGYKSYEIERELEKIDKSGEIGVGVFEGKYRLVEFNKDGSYKFLDAAQKYHNIVYIDTFETSEFKSAVEEFEFLLNNPRTKEYSYQSFFENHPDFILNDEYKKAYSHLTLECDDGPLIPDFLLEPIEQNSLVDILELKLPTTRIYVLHKNRIRFSSAVMEAVAQLREYQLFFDERENREKIQKKYGLLAYRPKMIVIIGRRGNIDPISEKKIQSDFPQLILRTYDEVLLRAKNRLGK